MLSSLWLDAHAGAVGELAFDSRSDEVEGKGKLTTSEDPELGGGALQPQTITAAVGTAKDSASTSYSLLTAKDLSSLDVQQYVTAAYIHDDPHGVD
jgi:hypothetical protein